MHDDEHPQQRKYGLLDEYAHLVGQALVQRAEDAFGDEAEQNTPFGFIKFGSRIDILLPKDAKLLVEIGDSVVGTQTPIARIGGVAESSLETPEEDTLEAHAE